VTSSLSRTGLLFPYGITTIKLVPEEAQTAAEMIRRVLLAAEPV